MAVKIPTYEDRLTPSGFGVTPRAQGVEISGAEGAAMQNLGRAGSDFAGTQIQMLQRKEDADAVASVGKIITDAHEKWNQYTIDKYNEAGDGAQGFHKNFMDDFAAWRSETASTITNDRARTLFESNANSLQTSYAAKTMEMEARAGVAARDGKIETAVQKAADTAARDSTQYQLAREQIMSTIANMGYDPITRAARAKAALAVLNEATITGEIKRNPEVAKAALEQRYNLKPANDAERAAGIDGKPAPVASGFDTLWSAQIGQESGGNQFRNGNPIESPKGAIGIAQVMPGTGPEAARYAGLPWDSRRFYQDAGYNEALGKAYMKHQLETFGGDVQKALAAYNMGPGSESKGNGVKGLVAKYGNDWLAHAPQETQDYVKSITAKSGSAGTLTPGVSTSSVPVPDGVKFVVASLDIDRVPTYLASAQAEQHRQMATAQAAMTTTEGDHIAAFMNGETVSKPLTEQDYVTAYGPKDGASRYANYHAIADMGADINALKTTPVDQQAVVLDKYKPNPDDPGYELKAKRYEMVAKAIDAINKARNDDPVAYAQQAKIGDVQPLNFNNADAFASEMRKREGVASVMGRAYSTPQVLLSKSEAQALSTGFNAMTTNQKLNYLTLIQSSVKDPAAYRSVLQQIAPDSPVTAIAGMLMGKQGSVAVSGSPFKPVEVASVMIEGESLINPNKATKEANGRGREFPMPKEQDIRDEFNSKVGKAFAGNPDAANFAYQGVKAYYAGKASRIGDVSGQTNSKVLDEAIDAVLGGVSKVNGEKVIRPWGMDEDKFKDGLKAAFNQAMAANGYKGQSVDNFGLYTLRSYRDGQYLLNAGTGTLPDKNGNPIILDMNKPAPAPAVGGSLAGTLVKPGATPKMNTQQPATK